MVSANAHFQSALKFHQDGNYALAEPLYREILQHEPNHIDANCLLGTLFMQVGRLEESVRFLRQAVSLQPSHSIAHNNLGHALHDMGKIEAAIREYQTAVRLDPSFTEALNNLGCAMRESGQLEKSGEIFNRVISLDPNSASGYFNLGLVKLGQKDPSSAIAHFEQATQLRHDYFEAWMNLGHACYQEKQYEKSLVAFNQAKKIKPNDAGLICNIGAVYMRQKNNTIARQMFQVAIAVQPDFAEAYANLGHLCQEERKFKEAISHYEKAIAHSPNYVDPLINLGVCYQHEERIEDAVKALDRALRLEPDRYEARLIYGGLLYRALRCDEAERELVWCLDREPNSVNALNSLGSVYLFRGQFRKALELYRRAISIEPNNALAHWNAGTTLLSLGELSEGWVEWDWGTQTKERSLAQRYTYPMWSGERLHDKTILIYAEQGLGDEILFASCVADIIEQAGRCVIQCDPRLAQLFSRSFPKAIIHGADREESHAWLDEIGCIDYQCPSGSLPRYLRYRLDQFHNHSGYLKYSPDKKIEWQRKISEQGQGLRIGLAWRGFKIDFRRAASYTNLINWTPILTVPGITFVSLQTGDVREEINQVRRETKANIVHFQELDFANDIDSLAALTASLDLVLSPEMTVYNLAGSVGVPTWVLASYAMKRPWAALGTQYLPWYPSVRLYQQATPGDWSELFERTGTDLKNYLKKASRKDSASMTETITARPRVLSVSPEQAISHEPIQELITSFIHYGNTVVDVTYQNTGVGSTLQKRVGPTGRVINLQVKSGSMVLPQDLKACDVVRIAVDADPVTSLCILARDVVRWRPILLLELSYGGVYTELAGVLNGLDYKIAANLDGAQGEIKTTTVVCAPMPPVSRENPSHLFSDPLAAYGAGSKDPFIKMADSVIPGDASANFLGSAVLPYARIVRALIRTSQATTILEYGAGTLQQYAIPLVLDRIRFSSLQDYWGTHDVSAYEPTIAGFDLLNVGPCDGVLCPDLLTRIPPADAPWVVKEIFDRARKFVFARVSSDESILTTLSTGDTGIRSIGWWLGLFECIANMYGIPYLLVAETGHEKGKSETHWFGNFNVKEIESYY